MVCCLVIQDSTSGVVAHPRDLRVSQYVFLSSPHLWLIIGLICDLFVSYIDSVMN